MLTTVPGLPREGSRMGLFWLLLELGNDHALHPHPRGPASSPRCLTLWWVCSSEVPLLSRHNDDQRYMRWPGQRAGTQKTTSECIASPDPPLLQRHGPSTWGHRTAPDDALRGGTSWVSKAMSADAPLRSPGAGKGGPLCQTRVPCTQTPSLRPAGRPARTHVAQEAAVGCPGLHAARRHAPPAPSPCDSRRRGQGRGDRAGRWAGRSESGPRVRRRRP